MRITDCILNCTFMTQNKTNALPAELLILKDDIRFSSFFDKTNSIVSLIMLYYKLISFISIVLTEVTYKMLLATESDFYYRKKHQKL